MKHDKKILALPLLFLVMAFAPSQPQNNNYCCAISDFAALAQDPNFGQAHELPRPLTNSPEKKGKFVQFPTLGDITEGRAFVVPGKKNTKKVLFMIHEWWGLNDHIQEEAIRYQADLGNEVTVVALDLYDGKLAQTREEAGQYMQGVSIERARQIIHGAFNYVGTDARVATIGWCFGGGWSLQTALLLREQASACVIYYGMPEKDPEVLKNLSAPVLGIFAEQDRWITPQVAEDFAAQLRERKHPVDIHIYPADHAFANPTSPRYVEAHAQDARQKTLDFLKANI
ncbi:MAG: dienelactone hydrolase family protein [Bernardetiaceae bacterium]